MAFINKCVNYSQTNYLKSQLLMPFLKKYNDFIVLENGRERDSTWSQLNYFIIPNNNTKYYLFVCRKTQLENTKDTHNIFYLFPDKNTLKITGEQLDDFYLETNHFTDDNFLFEGYLYTNTITEKQHFLVTDILVKNDTVIKCDYALRFTLLNETIMPCIAKLKNINNNLSVHLHPVFCSSNENMVDVFCNNFCFASQINCMERVMNFRKSRHFQHLKPLPDTMKKITKGIYTDVYNVFDEKTGEANGILYVKGIKESKALTQLFSSNKESHLVLCTYNTTFNKWQPKNT